MQPIKCLSKKQFYWSLKRNLRIGQSFIVDKKTHISLSGNGYCDYFSTKLIFSDKPVPASKVGDTPNMSASVKNVNLAIKRTNLKCVVYVVIEIV